MNNLQINEHLPKRKQEPNQHTTITIPADNRPADRIWRVSSLNDPSPIFPSEGKDERRIDEARTKPDAIRRPVTCRLCGGGPGLTRISRI